MDASGRPLLSPKETEDAEKIHTQYRSDLFELMNGFGPMSVEEEIRFQEKYGTISLSPGVAPPEWAQIYQWTHFKQLWVKNFGWMDWDMWNGLKTFGDKLDD